MLVSLARWLMVALACVLYIPLASVMAQESFKAVYHPTLDVPRATQAIHIDGDMSDPGWKTAARTNAFCEHSPGDMSKPDVRSAVMITYDDANLYIALIAWDDPRQVRATYAERDNIFKDDYFGVMLDPYNDNASGYELFVNPMGIQGDLRVTNSSGNEDETFDLLYSSAGKVTDSGYQVELAIPFSSLRFPNTDVQTWKAQFWRDRQRNTRYRYCWAAVNRNDPCWICQWGTLTGIRGIKPSNNIEFLPSVIGHQSGSLNVQNSEPVFNFSNENPAAEISMGARMSPTSSSTAEVTVNPDFSQVESDPGQIDANSTFALYYNEKRPFFQEGSELYKTPINAVYTRSINDPIVAGKFTGRFGKTNVAYSIARDDHSPFTLPFFDLSQSTQGGKSLANIFRAQTAIGKGSTVGVLMTDRRVDGGGSGTVAGVDGSLRFLKTYELDIQGLYSHTKEPNDTTLTSDPVLDTLRFDGRRYTAVFDGESYNGHAVYVQLSRNARVWQSELDYGVYTPTFRTDNGFVNRNDYQQANFWTGLVLRKARGLILQFNPQISVGGILPVDHSMFNFRWDELEDCWVNPHVYINTLRQSDINLDYVYSREIYNGKAIPGISRVNFDWSSRFSSAINMELFYSYGHVIARNIDDPQLAVAHVVGLYATFRPTVHLTVEPSLDYSRLDYRESYLEQHPDTAKNIFKGYIFRTRTSYQFNREWKLRLVVQYDDFYKRFDFEPLLTWQLNPFTIFYVGANSRLQNYTTDQYTYLNRDYWKESSRQFFAKLQYLFRV